MSENTLIVKQQITFFCFLWKLLPFHWLCIRAHTVLQQLQNLGSNDIMHGYQTCLLVESFL